MVSKLESAELVIIGDELLAGAVNDVNIGYLTSKLLEIGLSVSRVTVTGDDPITLEKVLSEALQSSRLVISSGGLGPTSDDPTRAVAARLFGRELYSNKSLLTLIRKRYARLGRKVSNLGATQALVPRGAILLGNPVGAAPGIVLVRDRSTLILLPGVPSEVRAITESGLLAYLSENFQLSKRHILLVRTSGKVETELQELLTPFLFSHEGLKISYLPKRGTVDLRLEASSERRLGLALKEIRKLLGQAIYATGEKSLAEAVGELLLKQNATLSVAESCTGGMLASAIVDVAGSSRYFLGGIVSYSNEAKESLLGVPHMLITRYGAVSPEVAQAMAEGARERFGSTYAVSITGVAGPGGGTKAKPVGLVYICAAGPGVVKVERTFFPSTRIIIRERSVVLALALLRTLLLPHESTL